MRRAVFLDRDGTLVREVGYLSRIEDLEILPGVPEALRRLERAGYLRLVLTNQSGIARGYFEPAVVEETHRELQRRLRSAGADVEGFYVCPHHPDFGSPCECRKPSPGLLRQAGAQWDVDVAASWVVGDKVADVELARRVGCRAALVRTGYGREAERELAESLPEVVADDLAGVVEAILRDGTGSHGDGPAGNPERRM